MAEKPLAVAPKPVPLAQAAGPAEALPGLNGVADDPAGALLDRRVKRLGEVGARSEGRTLVVGPGQERLAHAETPDL